jgi:uncharacterized protein (TIGR03086 family)
MPGTADPLRLLARAIEQCGALVARIRPDQSGLPTPCRDFDVRALVNHTVFDAHSFTAMLNGAERGSPDADLLGDDWAAAYQTATAALLAAWRRRGTDGTLQTRIGEFPATWAVYQHTANLAVHGWDIATATRQSTRLDPEVGREALEWGRENLKPQLRGTAFGPEVEVPENAPVYERLAGFFGRDPFYIRSPTRGEPSRRRRRACLILGSATACQCTRIAGGRTRQPRPRVGFRPIGGDLRGWIYAPSGRCLPPLPGWRRCRSRWC